MKFDKKVNQFVKSANHSALLVLVTSPYTHESKRPFHHYDMRLQSSHQFVRLF